MKTFLRTLAAFTALILATPSHAADKGGLGMPPAKIDATGAQKPMFSGCYVSAAGSTVFAEFSGAGDSVRAFMAGVGCDYTVGKIVVGIGADYGFAEHGNRLATLNGRVGVQINPHLLGYGILVLTMDGRDIKLQDSALSAGVGIETYLGSKHWTVFVEGTAPLSAYGDLKGVEIGTVKGGLRFRF